VFDRVVVEQSLGLVIDIYKSFREELLSSYGHVDFVLKADNSQVTELDLRIEKTLKQKLGVAYPQFGFRGEETGIEGSTDSFWLVDPIDGTSSFIRGLANCTNMAALIIDRKPVATVIYNFVTDELYTAIDGEGAYKNSQRIHVSERLVKGSLVECFNPDSYAAVRTILRPLWTRTYSSLGAAGHTFSCIAEGKYDGAINIGIGASMHDIVPGMLLIKEAGGEVVSFDTADEWDIDTEQFFVGTPPLAAVFREHADQLKAEFNS